MTLNEAMTQLRQLSGDWEGFLLNPNYVRRNAEATWKAGKAGTTRLPHQVTADTALAITSDQDYSFQCSDGAILRFWYSFDSRSDSLVAASMGYYDCSDNACYEALRFPDGPGIPWVRVDYDPVATQDIIHEACHMHISLSPEVRIPLGTVPSPRQFAEAIIAWFYPGDYKEYRSNELDRISFERLAAVNAISHQCDINRGAGGILHLTLAPLVRLRPTDG